MIPQTFWLLPFVMLYVASCSNSTKSNPNGESTSEQALRIMTYNIHHANPPSEGDSIDIDAIAYDDRFAEPIIGLDRMPDLKWSTEIAGVVTDAAAASATMGASWSPKGSVTKWSRRTSAS